jgi:hypothetical protein
MCGVSYGGCESLQLWDDCRASPRHSNEETAMQIIVKTSRFEFAADRCGVYVRLGRRDWYWPKGN